MKLLLVSHRFPWPLTRGDTLTVFKLAEHFSRRHEVDLLCHAPQEPTDADRIRPLVRNLVCVPFSPAKAAGRLLAALPSRQPLQVAWCGSGELVRKARELCRRNEYDIALAYYVRTAEALRGVRAPAKVLAMQLAMSLQWRRSAERVRNPLKKLVRSLEARRLRTYESKSFDLFDRCLLISPADAEAIPGRVNEKIIYNPHGVDTERFRPDASVQVEPKSIVFTGLMQFHPNADAICAFVRDSFPRLVQKVPEATLTIVGKNPPPAVRTLEKDPRITVTGTVPEIVPYLRRTAVAIAPIRICAGLQNKVLEAMSTATATVITSAANEGIDATDGEHCLIRDDPAGFADAVVELLKDDSRREKMGRSARAWVQERWTWEYHFSRLESKLEALVESKS
ncbi:MAG: glycosyltransferase [Phycisphaerae bacterium]